MTAYRRRPVVVEAVQWTGDNLDEVREWLGDEPVFYPNVGLLLVEGVGRIRHTDFLVRDERGVVSRVAAEAFAAAYEAVEEVGA